jgi:hypothetical protein
MARRLAGGAVAAAALVSACSLSPILIGQIYRIDTPRDGTCQPFELQFVVNAQRAIQGTLGAYGQPPSADLSGTMGQDGSFRMTATGVVGHGGGTLSGRFTSGVSTISIVGPVAGPGCDGHTLHLYLGRYLRFFGGGGGGNR